MVLTFTALFLVAAAPAAALTVEDCVRLALARSPAVRAALADAQAAAALVRSARAAYWPSLAAKGDYGVSKGFDRTVTNGGQTDALVSLGATLLDGGLRDARLAAAQASLRSATAKQVQQRADVVFVVRAAYFQAVAADAALAIRATTSGCCGRMSRSSSARRRGGSCPTTTCSEPSSRCRRGRRRGAPRRPTARPRGMRSPSWPAWTRGRGHSKNPTSASSRPGERRWRPRR